MISKLREIQQKLIAPKSQLNKFGNYKYRSCEDILEAVKPLLGGLVLTITDEIVLVGERYYVKATAVISDGTNQVLVSALAREEETKKGMDAAQITGAASSYARKYALNGLFCIDDSKDADHTNTGNGLQEKITDKQYSGLLDLINAYGVDEGKFIAYLKVDSLKSLPAEKYGQAVAALEQKGKQKKCS